ncbi:avidin/streptavidin family protein [Rhizobium laguerreae]|uniref:avidin/streptavidin family protein n=1 Tax=Rhizobium laguerreae TaxID=1076926 RepID=UPI001C8FFC19|nr:avidin/streptavidin family protein [Rhizobium laguerreae]MBY3565704.1 hypothetical protein [Rhizobium laguerreae]
MLKALFASMLFVTATLDGSFAQNAFKAPSVWINERGSILTIEKIEASGDFLGTFVNKAAGSQCRDDPYLAEGKILVDKIYFAVAFADRVDSAKNCMTVTEWRGTVSAGSIATTWSLAYPGPNGLVLIGGADKFDLQP